MSVATRMDIHLATPDGSGPTLEYAILDTPYPLSPDLQDKMQTWFLAKYGAGYAMVLTPMTAEEVEKETSAYKGLAKFARTDD